MVDQPAETRKDTRESKSQVERTWSENHGGLMFLLVVFGAIAFIVLYELVTGR